MATPGVNPWHLLESRVVYQTAWLRVREDRVMGPNGSSTYSVVELPHSIAVVVLNDRDEVALVGQWRYPLQRFSWEVPTGGFADRDESPQSAAEREVQEETGVVAAEWRPLGTIDNSNGSTTDTAHLFLASNLASAASHPDPDENLVIRWVSFDRAIEMIDAGEITESGSVVSLLKVDRWRGRDV